jgi:hypothetical protein
MYESGKELAVPDNVMAMAWYSSCICMAYEREYSRLGIDRGDVSSIAGSGDRMWLLVLI